MQLPTNRANWPPQALVLFCERRNICQVDGNVEEHRAEEIAESQVRREWADK